MKGLKLSKTSWLILSTGVFVVALAGLGLTRSQQVKEQTKIADELTLSEKSLETIQTAQLSQQLESLKVKLEDSEAQLKEAQSRLRQTVVSVDVTDQFFQIAANYDVIILNMTTTTISQAKYEGITCDTVALASTITGKATDIINFIIGLNNGFITGKVQSVQMTIAPQTADDTTEPDTSTASISMMIYSYEGM
jgi:hypothetical protein